MKFNGTLEDLKDKLKPIAGFGEWLEINQNHAQFRHDNGGILNWYFSTGSMNFQGKPSGAKILQSEIESLLQEKPAILAADDKASAPLMEVSVKSSKPEPAVAKKDVVSNEFVDSELIIGLVGATGTDLESVVRVITDKLSRFRYKTESVKISKDVIPVLCNVKETSSNYERINNLMECGNNLRKSTGNFAILAQGAAAKINQIRKSRSLAKEGEPLARQAFIIHSLKHPEEVQALRKIYSNGFFLIGIYADESRRLSYLTKNKNVSPDDLAKNLIKRDADESEDYGQHTRDTYHLSDFFINFDGNIDKFERDIWRIIDLIFGKPFVTPTFDEFAMFMAFSSSLRSADLSRQVGAVIAKEKNIISTGANDIPRFGGGLYWPDYNDEGIEIVDEENGRDYMRGQDSNAAEKEDIIKDVLSKLPIEEHQKEEFAPYLKSSRIKDITEYGRVVHAEMEAILAGARSGISVKDGHLYCTTFPCHNCAKHIIASGIKRVVYVEPYPKSRALDFHNDSISDKTSDNGTKVVFEPFVGVGPRSFFNLFSTSLGSGAQVTRKDGRGKAVVWTEEKASLRMQMLPSSYIERENVISDLIGQHKGEMND